jgi:pyruvate dehydrogenase E2 component (dihydrolipoamide acetyltransferase)
MSTYEFKLPDIGEGVTEGEIVKWLVAVGDVVSEDQPMVEVMTDKATVTITAPKAGTIRELRGAVGGVVPVHSVLVVFDLGGGAGAQDASGVGPRAAPAPAGGGAGDRPSGKKDDGPAATAVGDIKEDLPGMSLTKPKAPAAATATEATAPGYFNAKPLATPATRKLARDLGVDLRTVAPSGPHSRVLKDDVSRAASGAHAAPTAPAQAPSASAQPATAPRGRADVAQAVAPLPGDTRAPMRGVRKRIFEGMSRSKHTAAHFTFVEECDVTALIALRDRLRPRAEAAGVKLTYLPFIVKAVVAALKKHPHLEVTNEIVQRDVRHIGIASSTDAGLVVPVVRDADEKSILDVARDIARLAEDTKNMKTKPEDLGNSVFTITSLGAQGGLFATPILNFPEVGILGVHKIKERPVVKNGQIVIGQVMLLSLSFDHRIIDGHVGAAFAYDIIGYLEDPDRLFLEG